MKETKFISRVIVFFPILSLWFSSQCFWCLKMCIPTYSWVLGLTCLQLRIPLHIQTFLDLIFSAYKLTYTVYTIFLAPPFRQYVSKTHVLTNTKSSCFCLSQDVKFSLFQSLSWIKTLFLQTPVKMNHFQLGGKIHEDSTE